MGSAIKGIVFKHLKLTVGGENMTIKVATKKQTTIDSLKNQASKLEGCDKIISEQLTGNTMERPKCNKLVNRQLRTSDTLITPSWNRLVQNFNNGLNVIKKLSAKVTADFTIESPAKYNDHQWDYAMKLLAEKKSYTEIERKTSIDKSTLMLLLPNLFRI